MSTESSAVECDEFLSHPPAVVWRALTDPEVMVRWWAAGDIRAVVGHRFTIDMGRNGVQPCEVLEVEPERLLRYTMGDGSDGSIDTTVTWRLVPEGSGTRLLLRHEGFDLDSPIGREALAGIRWGWPVVLGRLEPVLQELAPT